MRLSLVFAGGNFFSQQADHRPVLFFLVGLIVRPPWNFGRNGGMIGERDENLAVYPYFSPGIFLTSVKNGLQITRFSFCYFTINP